MIIRISHLLIKSMDGCEREHFAPSEKRLVLAHRFAPALPGTCRWHVYNALPLAAHNGRAIAARANVRFVQALALVDWLIALPSPPPSAFVSRLSRYKVFIPHPFFKLLTSEKICEIIEL